MNEYYTRFGYNYVLFAGELAAGGGGFGAARLLLLPPSIKCEKPPGAGLSGNGVRTCTTE